MRGLSIWFVLSIASCALGATMLAPVAAAFAKGDDGRESSKSDDGEGRTQSTDHGGSAGGATDGAGAVEHDPAAGSGQEKGGGAEAGDGAAGGQAEDSGTSHDGTGAASGGEDGGKGGGSEDNGGGKTSGSGSGEDAGGGGSHGGDGAGGAETSDDHGGDVSGKASGGSGDAAEDKGDTAESHGSSTETDISVAEPAESTAAPAAPTVAASAAEVAAGDAVVNPASAADSAAGDDGRSAAADRSVAFDRDGNPAANHELLVLAASPQDLEPLRELGLRIVDVAPLAGVGMQIARIALPAERSPEAALAQLATTPSEAIFALNHLYGAGRMTGPIVHGRAAAGHAGHAAVGMIDGAVATGVLPAGVTVESRNFTAAGGAGDGHGTAVADLLARSGAGHIYAANVFAGRQASVEAIVRALDWMAANKVAVINISLAGPPNPILQRVIGLLEQRGHIIVAAIGNDGPAAPPLYPAAYAEVVAVTAVDEQGHVYRRANRGAWTMVAALGVDVSAVDGDGNVHLVSGTSFAAPVVSARLAGLLAAPDPAGRRRAIDLLIHAARDLGSPGRDPVYGYGLVAAQ